MIDRGDWRGAVGVYLTPAVREGLACLPDEAVRGATELRLRAQRRPTVSGTVSVTVDAPPISADEVRAMVDAMLGHAVHARQEELRQGFVTLPGGFRAGLCGRAVLRDGRLSSLQDIASITVRIARAIEGAADAVMPWLLDGDRPRSALIVSPPGLGKTTLLRDAARQISGLGFAVTIVDERSELAACLHGVPTLDVGENTDVLDGCPKADGMRIALRAMAPRVLVTDEIGHAGDAGAVLDAARCGVAVLATAHGRTYADIAARPALTEMLADRVFERIIALDAVGRVGAVCGADGGAV